MNTNRIEELAHQVTTEDEALTLITALGTRFGLSTTTFTRRDITGMAEDMAADVLTEHSPEFLHAMLPAVVDAVRTGYEWNKLDEILSEHGNETLAEAVRQTGAPLHGGEHTVFDARLLVDTRDSLTPAVEVPGFTSAQHAYDWAKSLYGQSASDAFDSPLCADTDIIVEPHNPDTDPQPLFCAVAQLQLVIRDTHTGRERTTLSVPLS